MDPNKVEEQISIPQQPHIDIERAGPSIEHPKIDLDQLADAGHTHTDDETFIDHLEHINSEIEKAHGTETQSIKEPLQESIDQIENPILQQEIHAQSVLPESHTVEVAKTPLLKRISSNVKMPFEYLFKSMWYGINSLLRQHGGTGGTTYHGYAKANQLPVKFKEVTTEQSDVEAVNGKEVAVETPLPVVEPVEPAPAEPMPDNITPFPQIQNEERHAA
jgi:hypothetical protein